MSVSDQRGPALPGGLRERLLDQVVGLLEADPAVAGVALVGSLGRGEEDNWSDIDLLILARGRFIAQLMDKPTAVPWARADLLSDGVARPRRGARNRPPPGPAFCSLPTQVKQTRGWQVTQPRPGWHEWTTPTGRTYTQGPWRYIA